MLALDFTRWRLLKEGRPRLSKKRRGFTNPLIRLPFLSECLLCVIEYLAVSLTTPVKAASIFFPRYHTSFCQIWIVQRVDVAKSVIRATQDGCPDNYFNYFYLLAEVSYPSQFKLWGRRKKKSCFECLILFFSVLVMSAETRKSTRTTLHASWIDCWMDMTTDWDLGREVGRTSDPSTHVLKCILCCVTFFVSLITSVAGGITEVKTDIFVTSFGPVSDVNMVRGENSTDVCVCCLLQITAHKRPVKALWPACHESI